MTALLAGVADINVLAEMDTTRGVEEAQRLRPEVVLYHAPIPGRQQREVVAALRQKAPRARIVILGREIHHYELARLVAAGISGYVHMGSSPEILLSALRAAQRGSRYIDPQLSDELLGVVTERALRGEKALSAREEEVLEELARGYTTKEIAAKLGISPKSVETYRARICEKLHLRTRADIIRYAVESGILHRTN